MNTIETSAANAGFYLVFGLSNQSFALPLDAVQRVVHAVEITRLPQAPELVMGLVNYKGLILPVLNIARRFHLAEKPLTPDHNFVMIQTPTRHFALLVDTVAGVVNPPPDQIVPPQEIVAGVRFIAGVMTMETGMMLIPDLENLLTHEEELALQSLMENIEKKDA